MNSKQRRKLLKKGYSYAAANEAWRRFNDANSVQYGYKNIKEGVPFDLFLKSVQDHVVEIFYKDLQREGMNEDYLRIAEAEMATRAEKILIQHSTERKATNGGGN